MVQIVAALQTKVASTPYNEAEPNAKSQQDFAGYMQKHSADSQPGSGGSLRQQQGDVSRQASAGPQASAEPSDRKASETEPRVKAETGSASDKQDSDNVVPSTNEQTSVQTGGQKDLDESERAPVKTIAEAVEELDNDEIDWLALISGSQQQGSDIAGMQQTVNEVIHGGDSTDVNQQALRALLDNADPQQRQQIDQLLAQLALLNQSGNEQVTEGEVETAELLQDMLTMLQQWLAALDNQGKQAQESQVNWMADTSEALKQLLQNQPHSEQTVAAMEDLDQLIAQLNQAADGEPASNNQTLQNQWQTIMDSVASLPKEEKQLLLQALHQQLQQAQNNAEVRLNEVSAEQMLTNSQYLSQLSEVIEKLRPDMVPDKQQTMLANWQQMLKSDVMPAEKLLEQFSAVLNQDNAGSTIPLNAITEALAVEVDKTAAVNQLAQQISRPVNAVTANQPMVLTQLAEQAQSLSQEQIKADVNQANLTKPEGMKNIANQVQMMVSQRLMTAEIRLDPPELGSMQIKVSMQGEQASVNFVVQTQTARDLLQDSQQRLKEMLAERGIALGESFVKHDQGQSGEAQQGFAQNDKEHGGQHQENGEAADDAKRVTVGSVADGVIDYFV